MRKTKSTQSLTDTKFRILHISNSAGASPCPTMYSFRKPVGVDAHIDPKIYAEFAIRQEQAPALRRVVFYGSMPFIDPKIYAEFAIRQEQAPALRRVVFYGTMPFIDPKWYLKRNDFYDYNTNGNGGGRRRTA